MAPTQTGMVGASTMHRILPSISAGCILLLTAALVVFYQNPALDGLEQYTDQQRQQELDDRRFLLDVILGGEQKNDPDDLINDDFTRDDKCKKYVSAFLNGTTSFKDVCQGVYEAYEQADCAEDTHVAIAPPEGDEEELEGGEKTKKKKHHHHHNDTDVDDFYIHWECCSGIYEYYSTHCHEPELDSGRLLGIVSVLVLCGMVKSFVHQVMELEWLPDVAIEVLVGAFAGAFLRVLAPDVVAERLTFNNDLFLHILLPPIIFQAALKIDKKSFRRDIFPILSFAVLGTVLSTFLVGLITYYMTRLGSTGTRLPLLDSLLFGSLISSIDPVATLGILSSVGVSQRDTLFTVIFGEGMVNDAVAIVLFDTLIKHLGDESAVGKATALEMLRYFTQIAFGSMAIGILCGGICTIYFYNVFGKHTPVTEVALFFAFALIPFYLSDMLGGSGIISIMVMGFFLDYYVIGGLYQNEEDQWMAYMQLRCNNRDRAARSEGDLVRVSAAESQQQSEPSRWDHWKLSWSRAFSGRGHLVTKSRHHVGFVAEVIADIMETAIFAYLGMFLFNSNGGWDWKLNGIGIFSCVTSRLLVVVAVSCLINAFVFCDVEGTLCRCFHRICADLASNQQPQTPNGLTQSTRTTMSAPLLSQYDDNPPTGEEDDDDDDDPESSVNKRFLDVKTQMMLVLAGVRGAVSFALVANVPLYNTVTHRGSQYKAELKSMTSSSIVFTLFVFGALTYFVVRKEQQDQNRERIAGNFTHRLMSMPLASDNEAEDDSDAVADSSVLIEMEAEAAPRRARFHSTG